ncbi:arabinose-5-phosphate isomerase KpsF/GutQ [Gluconobacter thailandicus F149-1 = NBRC 100600]|uniref:Capsule expression protein n=1 Tax=Gluconobacter thailandicus NBRC 3257 TaxID=1381097 RepID=A0ABQ0IY52_GLUTH|nr:KpsF/GutQ family sugar-phosphate isomerase [Gluconobacter thailandicus]GAN89425.1 arabinose-5-phosphate isomerase KpsF/GutQ [Gluconobacter frateurii M-2]KXV32671.1 D-arabinose 5-phosphate [Gluconobacter thailandicus]KXV51975.1 D-arabinose 5-phosphate [Gluconobacter thailandicus]GAC87256.1 capsule expression protein [Gluconobacter thailandicus NBRC 3255]GAD27141.1 capsule expression protein [Gluconobacter thailandicus NBRC 3257]
MTSQAVLPLSSALHTLAAERQGLEALEAAFHASLGSAFTKAVDRILHCSGRLIVTGIGKSGHIGRKIQATLASTGTPSLFVHPAEASHGDLGMVAPGDVILALSNSGETAELAAILSYASHKHLGVIAITSVETSALARAAEIALVLPKAREACPMGLAPTTSTLLQLALGDALAIALLEKRGFTASDFQTFHPGGRLGARLRPVRELMHYGETLPLGKTSLSLRSVILEMTRKAFGCMGVIDDSGVLCGLITDADLRRALHRDLDATTAEEVMNRSPITTTPTTLAQDVLLLMNARSKPITSLFVVGEDGRPQGIIHLHDLLRAGLA